MAATASVQDQELRPAAALPPGASDARLVPLEFGELTRAVQKAAQNPAAPQKPTVKALKRLVLWTASSSACRQALHEAGTLHHLVHLLGSKHQRVIAAAAGVLLNAAAFSSKSKQTLVEVNAVAALADACALDEEAVCAAAGALANLMHSNHAARLLAVDAGVAQVLARCLKRPTSAVQQAAARALANFVVGCMPAARAALKSGAVAAALRVIAGIDRDAKPVALAVRAVGNVAAADAQCRESLRRLGAPAALCATIQWACQDAAAMLSGLQQGLLQACWGAIANLARDGAAHREDFTEILPLIPPCLKTKDMARGVVSQAARATASLLQGCEVNVGAAVAVRLHGALRDALASKLSAETTAHLCRASQLLVWDNPDSQRAAVESGLLQAVVPCVGGGQPPVVWRAALAAVLEMTHDFPEAEAAARGHGLSGGWMLPPQAVKELHARHVSPVLRMESASGGADSPTQAPATRDVEHPDTGHVRTIRVHTDAVGRALHFGDVDPRAKAAEPVRATLLEDKCRPRQSMVDESTWPELEGLGGNTSAPFPSMSNWGAGAQPSWADASLDGDSVLLRGTAASWAEQARGAPPASIFRDESIGGLASNHASLHQSKDSVTGATVLRMGRLSPQRDSPSSGTEQPDGDDAFLDSLLDEDVTAREAQAGPPASLSVPSVSAASLASLGINLPVGTAARLAAAELARQRGGPSRQKARVKVVGASPLTSMPVQASTGAKLRDELLEFFDLAEQEDVLARVQARRGGAPDALAPGMKHRLLNSPHPAHARSPFSR